MSLVGYFNKVSCALSAGILSDFLPAKMVCGTSIAGGVAISAADVATVFVAPLMFVGLSEFISVVAVAASRVAKMGSAVVAFVWAKLGRFFAGVSVVLAGMPGICCRRCSCANEVVSVGRNVFVVNWAGMLPADCIAAAAASVGVAVVSLDVAVAIASLSAVVAAGVDCAADVACMPVFSDVAAVAAATSTDVAVACASCDFSTFDILLGVVVNVADALVRLQEGGFVSFSGFLIPHSRLLKFS